MWTTCRLDLQRGWVLSREPIWRVTNCFHIYEHWIHSGYKGRLYSAFPKITVYYSHYPDSRQSVQVSGKDIFDHYLDARAELKRRVLDEIERLKSLIRDEEEVHAKIKRSRNSSREG